MANIIQQLEDLKEWAQDPTRYARRLEFRHRSGAPYMEVLPEEFDELSPREEEYYKQEPFSTREEYRKGQLVEQGPEGVRQGYAKKSGFDVLGREYDAKPLTKNQVNMMRKNLPEGIGLYPSAERKGQWIYSFQAGVGRGTKDAKKVGLQLKATPENLDRLIELRDKTWKDFFPDRLSTREFKRLRFLPENIGKTNKAFAEVLNELGYRTETHNQKEKGKGKFKESTVNNRQITLGIGKDVGNIRPPERKISEVKKIIRNSSGGKDFLQVYSGNEAVLRKRANRLLADEAFYKTQGFFPPGKTNEEKLWQSFYRSATKGDRIKIVGEFSEGNFPRDADGYIDWRKKDKKGIPAWKRIQFVDTEAPKGKQKFKWGNLQADVDNAFGKGFFARNTRGYDLAIIDNQRLFGGKQLSTLVRDKLLMKDLEHSIFKREGVRRKPTKLEIAKWKKNMEPGYAMTEAHHTEGVAKNPYRVEPAFRVANRRLKDLEKSYKAGTIDKATFIKKINELPGGIRHKLDDVMVGIKSTEPMRIKAAVKASGFNKNIANQIFKSYQKEGIGTKCQWKGAEGGRIGYFKGGSDQCMRNAIQEHNRKLKEGDIGALKKQINLSKTKGIKNLLNLGSRGIRGLTNIIGGWGGAAIEAVAEGAFYEYGKQQGQTDEQARENLFLPKVAAKYAPKLWEKLGFEPFKTGVWEGPEGLIEEELLAGNESAQEYADGIKALQAEYDNASKIDFELTGMKANPGYTTPEQIEIKEQELRDSYGRIEELQINIKPGTPQHEAYVAAQEKQKAAQDERAQEHWGDAPAYKGSKQRQWQDEFLDYRGAKRKYRKDQPFAFKGGIEANIGLTKEQSEKGMRIPWEEYFPRTIDTPRTTEQQKWDYIMNQGGWDLTDKISAAGGVANMAGGGIANVRRPNAIPPVSGPMPQGGGLSTMFNRVKPW